MPEKKKDDGKEEKVTERVKKAIQEGELAISYDRMITLDQLVPEKKKRSLFRRRKSR